MTLKNLEVLDCQIISPRAGFNSDTAGFLYASLLTIVPLISSFSVNIKMWGLLALVDQRHDGNDAGVEVANYKYSSYCNMLLLGGYLYLYE